MVTLAAVKLPCTNFFGVMLSLGMCLSDDNFFSPFDAGQVVEMQRSIGVKKLAPDITIGVKCVFPFADIDYFASSPCMNNAICVDQVVGFDCHCQSGYNGTLCNIGMYIW